MGFLHGVEVIPVDNGAVPVTQARSGVIALIGTAPIGALNVPTLITSQRQASTTFGEQVPGFTIPQALKAIFDQGAGRVIVINVFDDQTATITAEAKTVTNGKVTLTHPPVASTITLTNSAGSTTYVAGTDYSVDAFGIVTVLDFTSIAEGASVKATYDYLDVTEFADADIIGTDVANVRTGLQATKDIKPLFGYNPGILCVPYYNEADAIRAEMIVIADYLSAIALVDAPGTNDIYEQTPIVSVSGAITARGAGQVLNTSSKRVVICYPYVKRYDVATDATVTYPFSPYLAGVMANNDNLRGYWVSPSNKEIKGILGSEILLTAEIGNENSDVNLLNEVGIVTLYQGFGTGLRTWGNRSAAYPSVTTPDVFISVQRTRDILELSLQEACLQFVDEPINNALIDAIIETSNAFIRTLVQRGALVDGSCNFNSGDNSAEEIALGHLVFSIDFMPPPPAERITLNTRINIDLLNLLIPQAV
jgi:uncharacterized protein